MNTMPKVSKASKRDYPYTTSQINIITAAEKVFSKHGIEGASLRKVALAAGQRNPFAVQYHFGDRDELVRAIFRFRLLELDERRGQMLAEIEKGRRTVDARAYIEMIYVPQLELFRSEYDDCYAGFLAQYLLRWGSPNYGDFGVVMPPNVMRVLMGLRKCLPHLSDAVSQRRLVSTSLVFFHFLSTFGKRENAAGGVEDYEEALSDTLAEIEMAICMPLQETIWNSV